MTTPEQKLTTTTPRSGAPIVLSELRVTRTEDGRYLAAWGDQRCIVRIGTCFPWTCPGAFVSLRNEDDKEVALIPDLAAVDPESRIVLRRALREAAFAFTITQVRLVRKEFEIRHWEVTCREGQRSFQTKVDDFPQPLPPRGLLITDVGGDVYVVEDWDRLDKSSRKQLALFID